MFKQLRSDLRFFFWPLFISILLVQCKKVDDAPVTPKSSAKSLTDPTIDGVTGASAVYDATTSTYTITVPFGTVVTALKLAFIRCAPETGPLF